MGLAPSGEINRCFVALAFVLPASIIPTSNRNLRNLCNLRIFHLLHLRLDVFSCLYSRRFAACRAVGLAKADPLAVDALVCGSLNELVPF